jgi:(1->4)-alpha-D-glucan 1-alpha-D-glucosylmutase
LRALGVSDLYGSPILKPTPGSQHGYDVCDHGELNPALGGEAGFRTLTDELSAHGLGFIFDVVPNHMGITDSANGWWMDVLENGPSSPYAAYFDIDWHPLKAEPGTENRVLLPILGDAYGKVLEDQELALHYEHGAFFVSYYDRRVPITPSRYAELLEARLGQVVEVLGFDHPDALELQSIVTAIRHLPTETETAPELVAERQREKEIVKRRIEELAEQSPDVRNAIESTVNAYNGKKGDRRSFDALHSLLDSQCYRLSYWRVAAEEINYRRFFDVNDLAAIRVELPDVFEATHRLLLRFIREGRVTGLRVDHADGLWDPSGYLHKLQRSAVASVAERWLDRRDVPEDALRNSLLDAVQQRLDVSLAGDGGDGTAPPFYLVVEKILGARERLHRSWPVHGTTGYDFTNCVNGLFVNSGNRKAFSNLYSAFTQQRPVRFADLINSTKKIIMLVSLASEVNELAYHLKRIAWKNRWYRDLTLNSLTHAIREVIAAFPVYRTYLRDDRTVSREDVAVIDQAVADAKRRNPRTAAAVFDFVRRVLVQEYPEGATDEDRAEWLTFAMRFQQTTSPVTAKGVEDTAFYVYNRLVSLNEVGGEPEQFGVTPAAFHRQNLERQAAWPHALLTLSTHDSKRSADVRARLNALSEMPRSWRRSLARWSRQNRPKRTEVDGALAPDRNDEYLIYQTLLGVWPLGDLDSSGKDQLRRRIQEYLLKAVREAKVHTSWVNPNQGYEAAVTGFIDRIFAGRPSAGFLADFARLLAPVQFYGMLNSLSQSLLQLTSPGLPDLYQGNELWAFQLVDPDNRQPVDFAGLAEVLAEVRQRIAHAERTPDAAIAAHPRALAAGARPTAGLPRETEIAEGQANELADLARDLLANWEDGKVKLFLTYRTLGERNRCPNLFSSGQYVPLEPAEAKLDHTLGFLRRDGDEEYAVIVPRLVVSLTRESPALPHGDAVWEEAALVGPEGWKGGTFWNVFTGEVISTTHSGDRQGFRMANALREFPVALLRRQ